MIIVIKIFIWNIFKEFLIKKIEIKRFKDLKINGKIKYDENMCQQKYFYSTVLITLKPEFVQYFIGFKGSIFKHIKKNYNISRIRYTYKGNMLEIWGDDQKTIDAVKLFIQEELSYFKTIILNDFK